MSVRSDFHWTKDDEPHLIRRKAILAKHPEIKTQCFGTEPLTFPICIVLVGIQYFLAYMMRDQSWPVIWALGYAIGGTINHSLQLAVHEVTHNLCFESVFANQLLAVFCNLPTCVASAFTFQRYHMEHHQFQGVDVMDTDIGTAWEGRFFTSPPMKVLWLLCQPFFYAIRPMMVNPKKTSLLELFNWAVVLASNFAISYYCGFKAVSYLLIGTFTGLGLHPAAGHFVAEHYTLTTNPSVYETYSYYGVLNWVNFNVGYHNEHHDFPRVPWSKLPLVKKLAPEFYDNLPCYTSYLEVFRRFIFDPTVNPFSRVKRGSTKAE